MSRGDQRDPLIALRIPPALDARLRATSASTGTSISEIVRSAIEASMAIDTAAAKRRKPRSMCEHRVRVGNYCRRCDGVV